MMTASLFTKTADPLPTLAEQLPELSPRLQAWETIMTLLRPVRDDRGFLRCSPKAILVTAPAGGRAVWLPISKVTRHIAWAGTNAPHPCEFFRLPVWLYKAKRLEILGDQAAA